MHAYSQRPGSLSQHTRRTQTLQGHSGHAVITLTLTLTLALALTLTLTSHTPKREGDIAGWLTLTRLGLRREPLWVV